MALISSKQKKLAINDFAPLFEPLDLSVREQDIIPLFFTNINKPAYSIRVPLPPELIGAICSRTSRAKGDLREVFAKEFVTPFDKDKQEHGKAFRDYIKVLTKHGPEAVFTNPKAREFYIKWLADYGDDSIAQMAGTYLMFSGISQIAIKHIEDQRVGIAPIEQSTRYVDYSSKIHGSYRYYTDPTFKKMGLDKLYKKAMDNLFDTYIDLKEKYRVYLEKKYPGETPRLYNTKTFDTLRGILPTSALSQVAFFANGQALEYLAARSLSHTLGEIRWVGHAALIELNKTIPAFLRRAEGESAEKYREYKSNMGERIETSLNKLSIAFSGKETSSVVDFLWLDPEAQDRIITSLIYQSSRVHAPYEKIFARTKRLPIKDKKKIVDEALKGRDARWMRMPRALEDADARVEIVMNIGAWRDLHRHRMKTQLRQEFTAIHGYDVPEELTEARLDMSFKAAVNKVSDVYTKIEKKDPTLAQYATVLAHRIRYFQKTNIRELIWESELRSGSQGHPNYREVALAIGRKLKNELPLIAPYIHLDENQYVFARRGTEERIKRKEKELERIMKNS